MPFLKCDESTAPRVGAEGVAGSCMLTLPVCTMLRGVWGSPGMEWFVLRAPVLVGDFLTARPPGLETSLWCHFPVTFFVLPAGIGSARIVSRVIAPIVVPLALQAQRLPVPTGPAQEAVAPSAVPASALAVVNRYVAVVGAPAAVTRGRGPRIGEEIAIVGSK